MKKAPRFSRSNSASAAILRCGMPAPLRQLSRAFTMVKAEDYTSLHDFYQKVASNDQQQLVLASTNTGKGN
jgi:hypothetical protein